jgi:hypothetical protein
MNWHNHLRDTRSPEELLDAALASIAPGKEISLRELSAVVFPDNRNDAKLALMIQDRVKAGKLERLARFREKNTEEKFKPVAHFTTNCPERLEFGVRIPESAME